MLIIFKLIFVLLLPHFQSNAQTSIISNPVGEKIPEHKIISINKSIMSCGDRSGLYIYSSLDIQAILSISNFLSDEKVKMTTDWHSFLPMKYNSSSSGLNDKDILNFPDDVKRILYICTTWNESFQLKLFQIPKAAIDNITSNVKKQKPWQDLNAEDAKQLNNFSEETIRDFVNVVLRSEVYRSIKGGFNKNPTLWSTPFTWRMINTTSEKESNNG
ncbi:hypothetical protein [Fluviispira multicolorata]|uniref:Uncharacterized protein n=1 Tax=Fluviispira multicolorata TaxID=2654512 RepID=A0A833JCL5_9BACT|nr:hypothetical protein [Fluviispira multicolorata]KAB8030793.1 hypothetical protein GCL57_07410 [Fluviispira multicolorata]